jgi:hypothetical protein
MADGGGALAQRQVAQEVGIDGVARWLSERFLD